MKQALIYLGKAHNVFCLQLVKTDIKALCNCYWLTKQTLICVWTTEVVLFFFACQNGHDSFVQLLLSSGANINSCIKGGASPLFIACQNGHRGAVKILIRNGADINQCLTNGVSPFYIACNFRHDDIIQLLLSHGADINLRMKGGVSPLYVAFETRRYKTVGILLNNGVVNNLDCGWEVNPDLVGCFDENDSTVKFLRQNDNILINIYDSDSYLKSHKNGVWSILFFINWQNADHETVTGSKLKQTFAHVFY